jgi:hypothetical protein
VPHRQVADLFAVVRCRSKIRDVAHAVHNIDHIRRSTRGRAADKHDNEAIHIVSEVGDVTSILAQ